MIVTAAVCFWNERPADLERCIVGIADIADRVVAVDGSYLRYPNATIRSPKRQIDAIRKAAKRVGLETLIIQPNRLWSGQVEKRSYLMSLAAVGSDWVVVVDVDHIISADRDAARAFLETTEYDVVSVPFWTPNNPSRSGDDGLPSNWHRDQIGVRSQLPNIFRALGNMRAERFHYWYSAMKDGQRFWLWGGDDQRPHLPVVAMEARYQVDHRFLFRTREQVLASRAFINDREALIQQTGQEDASPDLQPPVWDYETVPL